MIQLKPGTIIFGLEPEMLLGLQIVASIFADRKWDLMITSGLDGKHMTGSRHYAGQALDFRLPPGSEAFIVRQLSSALGSDFDVVLESDHIHVEFDKRGARLINSAEAVVQPVGKNA